MPDLLTHVTLWHSPAMLRVLHERVDQQQMQLDRYFHELSPITTQEPGERRQFKIKRLSDPACWTDDYNGGRVEVNLS